MACFPPTLIISMLHFAILGRLHSLLSSLIYICLSPDNNFFLLNIFVHFLCFTTSLGAWKHGEPGEPSERGNSIRALRSMCCLIKSHRTNAGDKTILSLLSRRKSETQTPSHYRREASEEELGNPTEFYKYQKRKKVPHPHDHSGFGHCKAHTNTHRYEPVDTIMLLAVGLLVARFLARFLKKLLWRTQMPFSLFSFDSLRLMIIVDDGFFLFSPRFFIYLFIDGNKMENAFIVLAAVFLVPSTAREFSCLIISRIASFRGPN